MFWYLGPPLGGIGSVDRLLYAGLPEDASMSFVFGSCGRWCTRGPFRGSSAYKPGCGIGAEAVRGGGAP